MDEGLFEQNGLQRWIQGLPQFLQKDGHTDADAVLQRAQETGVCLEEKEMRLIRDMLR